MIRKLFEPMNLKGIQLKNRFVRSATMEGMATIDGYPTQRTVRLISNIILLRK